MQRLHDAINDICSAYSEADKRIEWLLKVDKTLVVELLEAISESAESDIASVLQNIHTYSEQHKVKTQFYEEMVEHVQSLGRNVIAEGVHCVVRPETIRVDYFKRSDHDQRTNVYALFDFYVNDDLTVSIGASYSSISDPYPANEMYVHLLTDAKTRLKLRLDLSDNMVKGLVTTPDYDNSIVTNNLRNLRHISSKLGFLQDTLRSNIVEHLISWIKKGISIGSDVPGPLTKFLIDNAGWLSDKVYIDFNGIVIMLNSKTYVVLTSTPNGYKRTTKIDNVFKRRELSKSLSR